MIWDGYQWTWNSPDPNLAFDPAVGTNVVYPYGGGTENFAPGDTPYSFLSAGGNYLGGVKSAVPGTELYNQLRDDARTRDQQGVLRVAALVGGGAALGNTAWGSGTPGTGYGSGFASGTDVAYGSSAGGAAGAGIVPGGTAVGGSFGSLPALARGAAGVSSMAGLKGGGGGASDATDAQQRIALQLLGESDPLRQALIQRSGQAIMGGSGNSPQFAAYKAALEPQYASARDQIIADSPTGGGLTAALANLDTSRAHDLTAAQGSINESELARAMTLATGQTGQAMTSLGNAGQVQAAAAQANAEREAGLYSAIGTGLGAYFGSNHGGK